MVKKGYSIIVFSTTHHTMAAEALLKDNRIWSEIIPKPDKAKTECGLAIKIKSMDKEKAVHLFKIKFLKIIA